MTNNDDAEHSSLGAALTDLSDSATGLSSELVALNEAVDALQTSTEQFGDTQATASKTLAKAATELSTVSDGEATAAATSESTGWSAVADD